MDYAIELVVILTLKCIQRSTTQTSQTTKQQPQTCIQLRIDIKRGTSRHNTQTSRHYVQYYFIILWMRIELIYHHGKSFFLCITHTHKDTAL